MRTFLARAALFVTIFLLLFLAASAGDRLLRPDSQVELQLSFVESQKGKTHVILGDSHAALAIDARELPENWISFAYPADNLFDMYAKLQFLEKRHPVDVVFLPIDYHIITQYREENRNICASMVLLSNEEAREVWKLSRLGIFLSRSRCTFPLMVKAEREKTMMAFAEWLQSFLGKPRAQATFALSPHGGWVTIDQGLRLTTPKDIYRREAAEAAQHQIQDVPVVPALLAVYGEMIQFAHAHDMKVIGIRYPLDPAYLAALPLEKTQEIENALLVLDLDARFDWSELLRESPASFYNSNHLNASGATALTRLLVSRNQGTSP